MSGIGVLVILVAFGGAFVGASWERGRRAASDLQRTLRAATMLRKTAQKERGRALLIAVISLAALYALVRGH